MHKHKVRLAQSKKEILDGNQFQKQNKGMMLASFVLNADNNTTVNDQPSEFLDINYIDEEVTRTRYKRTKLTETNRASHPKPDDDQNNGIEKKVAVSQLWECV